MAARAQDDVIAEAWTNGTLRCVHGKHVRETVAIDVTEHKLTEAGKALEESEASGAATVDQNLQAKRVGDAVVHTAVCDDIEVAISVEIDKLGVFSLNAETDECVSIHQAVLRRE